MRRSIVAALAVVCFASCGLVEKSPQATVESQIRVDRYLDQFSGNGGDAEEASDGGPIGQQGTVVPSVQNEPPVQVPELQEDEPSPVQPYERTSESPDIDRPFPDSGWKPIDDRRPFGSEYPQLVILTECGLKDRNAKTGKFNSPCYHCNLANEAAVAAVERAHNAYEISDSDRHADIVIADIGTRFGQEIDSLLGDGRHSMTEIAGHQAGAGFNSLTPVLIGFQPGREPLVEYGWKGGDPLSIDASWYVTGFMGHRRDTPERWGDSVGRDPVLVGLATWAQYGHSKTKFQSWGATVDARKLLQDAGISGTQEIAPRTTLTVPEDMTPYLSVSKGVTSVKFKKPPYIKWKWGILSRTKAISRIDIAADFSTIRIYAEGYETSYPIHLKW